MRLKPDLPATPYSPPRGNGLASLPSTNGNQAGGDLPRPSSAVFIDKPHILASEKLAYGRGKLFLGRLDQKMIGIADQRHIVTIAGSGGGKSVCSLIPNLMLYDGSALVLDPKGELATETAAFRRDTLGQTVHVLDPWGVAAVPDDLRGSLNPLDALIDGDSGDLIDDADLIADALIIPAEKDSHWTDAARALVRALLLWLVLADEDETGGAPSVALLPRLLAHVAAAAVDESGEKAATLLHTLAKFNDPDDPQASSVIQNQGLMLLGMADKERSSVLSTARTQLAFLESPQLAAALEASSFALAEMKQKPCTVYLCLPASRMATHSRWLRLIVNLSIAALERERSTPPLPVLFVLEEFAALGHMRALESAVAYMRGFGVKIWTVLQDITQLKRHYKDSWETFLGNAGVLQAFSVTDTSTLDYLEKRLGKTTLLITNKQEVSSSSAAGGDSGLRREFRDVPLMAASEIGLEFSHAIAPDGGARGGLSLVLWSGRVPMMVERVYFGELAA